MDVTVLCYDSMCGRVKLCGEIMILGGGFTTSSSDGNVWKLTAGYILCFLTKCDYCDKGLLQ